MDQDSDLVGTPTPVREFQTTIWSEVLRAGRGDNTRAYEALSRLCQAYWYPIYSYVRRRGYDLHDAQDLTQGFFSNLLEKNHLESVDTAKGRFRSFLITALKWFLANEWDRAKAEKRGGNAITFSMDEGVAETRFQAEAVGTVSPENAYDRQFARAILERVMSTIKAEFDQDGLGRFEKMSGHVFGQSGVGSYADTAKELGLSEGGVKSAVRRMRLRCGELFRLEITQTVALVEEIDDEIRYLLSLLGD
jgi:DNA-directed RNA polymerase specialized sigma24 family protein